jgi:hypothetical protein
VKNNTPEAHLTLFTNLQLLGVQHEMDFPEGSNIKAPWGANIPLGPFLSYSPLRKKYFNLLENPIKTKGECLWILKFILRAEGDS